MHKIFYTILAVILTMSFAACSEGAEDNNIPNHNPGNNGQNDDKEEDSLNEDVYRYISVNNVSYENYAVNFTINTSLHKYYPNKSIKFYFIYVFYDTDEELWLDIDPIYDIPQIDYSVKSNGEKQYVVSAGICNPSDDRWADYDLYQRTYVHLKEKMANGETLTSSENDLYREAVRLLDDLVDDILSNTCFFRISASIDGKEYIFKRISAYDLCS